MSGEEEQDPVLQSIFKRMLEPDGPKSVMVTTDDEGRIQTWKEKPRDPAPPADPPEESWTARFAAWYRKLWPRNG